MKNRNLSGHYAALLLAAWDSADSSRIRSAADQAEQAPALSSESLHNPTLCSGTSSDALEQERLEMVRGAAALLRQRTLGEADAYDVSAALRLLSHISGHLAVTEEPLRARRASGQR